MEAVLKILTTRIGNNDNDMVFFLLQLLKYQRALHGLLKQFIDEEKMPTITKQTIKGRDASTHTHTRMRQHQTLFAIKTWCWKAFAIQKSRAQHTFIITIIM